MKSKEIKPKFVDFIRKFPKIDLPITLTQESQFAFSEQNESLHPLQIQEFIGDIGDDDLAETIPCLRIPNTEEFVAIIYWTASLLSYEYHLATYTKKGELIDKKVIAGLKSNGERILQRVATIDLDWIIYIIEGETKRNDPLSTSIDSKERTLELLLNGQIIVPM